MGLIGVDESIINSCHFGFGDGGRCGTHLDVVISKPAIEQTTIRGLVCIICYIKTCIIMPVKYSLNGFYLYLQYRCGQKMECEYRTCMRKETQNCLR